MAPVRGDGMRGLAVFISDIRNCKSKEAEIKRINKELANIRSKFKGDKTLDGYQKKKYVCKLLFIFLLGHDIDFGHMEAVNLLSSNKYSEKQIVCKVLFSYLSRSIGTQYTQQCRITTEHTFSVLGLSLYLGSGEYQQRFDSTHHSKH